MSFFELQSIAGLIGIYVILALSLNVVCGLTGLLQLGHAGFFAVGAYAAGLVSIYFTVPSLGCLNFVAGAAVAMLLAGIFSVLIGIPCLRLKGDYLAIATLGFAEMVRLILMNTHFPGGRMFPGERIGGPTGISFTEFPGDVWKGFDSFSANYAKWWVIWIFAALTWMILLNVKRSSIGRAMMCIREDEIAAKVMGIDVPRYKITAFLISAVFAGLAGALFFHKELVASPSGFTLLCSIEILLMVVLGGLGSVTGSMLGALILGVTPFVLKHLHLAQYQQIIYALLLIVLIRLAPNGILGMKEAPEWVGKLFSINNKQ